MQKELLSQIDKYINDSVKCPHASKQILQNRALAYEEFKKMGFPTKNDEEWRYDDLSFLDEIPFKLSNPRNPGDITKNDIEKFKINEDFENVIVTVNGAYVPELSTLSEDTHGVEIKTLQEACKDNQADMAEHFGRYAKTKDKPFRALNTSIITDGLFIKFPKNYSREHVFHIIHIIDVRKGAYACNTRTLLKAEPGATFKIIESYHDIGEYPGWTNAVTEVYGDANSDIDYYKLQDDMQSSYLITSTDVELKQDSNFHSATITLDGKYVRNNLNVSLNGENINANFHGFFFPMNGNFFNNNTYVNHAMPNCNSDEVYKGIIDSGSTGVFKGKIYIAQDAQKSNAYQSNKNILLSETAEIYTQPQLEIYADDVKCSHGATTGYLDKDALFYCRARGISESTARALLLNAFAADVFEKINIPTIREKVKSLTAQRLNINEDVHFCKI